MLVSDPGNGAGPVVSGTPQALAIAAALAGSATYAIAIVTQQGAAARLPAQRAFDIAVVLRLARRPAWLAGLALVAVGVTLQAVALSLGRLVVIEPMFASGMLLALLLAAYRDRRPLRPAEWFAALAVVAGLGVFFMAGRPAGGQRSASAAALGGAAAIAVAAGLVAVVAGWRSAAHRALLFGLGGGLVAGATDAATKSVAVLAARHPLRLPGDPRLYLLVLLGLLTYTIQQNGYRAAGLAAFLPAFAVMEPVSGALLGLIVYRERLGDGPAQIMLELAACAAAGWGIARLARSGAAWQPRPGAGPITPAATVVPVAATPAGDGEPA